MFCCWIKEIVFKTWTGFLKKGKRHWFFGLSHLLNAENIIWQLLYDFFVEMTDCRVRYSRNTQQMVQMEDSKHWDALAITVLVVTVLSITFTYGCVTHSSVFHINWDSHYGLRKGRKRKPKEGRAANEDVRSPRW